jgi:peptidoglycan/LPS O-acetylase OafA/YrhL
LWSHWVDYKVIIRHFILVGNFDTDAFNPVIWSLVHEMRMSILFPLVLYIVRLKPGAGLVVVYVVALIGATGLFLDLLPGKGYYNSYCFTLFYLHIFILGGLIAKNQSLLVNAFKNWRSYQKTALIITALLLYNYAHLLSLLFGGLQAAPVIKERLPLLISDVLISLAACVIIIATISLPANNYLTKKAPLFLGKISYSLYLLHLPVIGFIYFTLYGKLPLLLVLALGFVSAFLVAALFNKYVEQVSAKAAKLFLLNGLFNRKK